MDTQVSNNISHLPVETSFMSPQKIVISLVVIVLVGTGIGFVLSRFAPGQTTTTTESTSTQENKGAPAQVVGVKDKGTFKDSVTGTLKEGGIEGESDFHLERPGGESQNVYLTSTTVDLSDYIGKKVKVWGQTINSQKAGWFMDVGLVEVP